MSTGARKISKCAIIAHTSIRLYDVTAYHYLVKTYSYAATTHIDNITTYIDDIKTLMITSGK